MGIGDLHDKNYASHEAVIPFYGFADGELIESTPGHCLYSVYVYPTKEFEDGQRSSLPLVLAVAIASACCFLYLFCCICYRFFNHRRTVEQQHTAASNRRIVSSLFPSHVRDQLYFADSGGSTHGTKNRLKLFLSGGNSVVPQTEDEIEEDFMFKGCPIADTFADTTVLVADIAGFTGTSALAIGSTDSVLVCFVVGSHCCLLSRYQHGVLLVNPLKSLPSLKRSTKLLMISPKRKESTKWRPLVRASILICKHRTFLVSPGFSSFLPSSDLTSGDSYVAVAGVPKPRKDHAVAMARFALSCLHRMHTLTKKLEIVLGPDTADLDIRFGLHSGSVTAGVVRGDRSRFQLFGDSMNVASRMEKTSFPGKIQVSKETADLLVAAGKSHWLVARQDRVLTQSSGEMQTYWLLFKKAPSSVACTQTTTSESDGGDSEECSFSEEDAITSEANAAVATRLEAARIEKVTRLVQWNADIMLALLKKLALYRQTCRGVGGSSTRGIRIRSRNSANDWFSRKGDTAFDELTETISFPAFDACRHATFLAQDEQQGNVQLGEAVEEQLLDYCSAVASMYRDNAFHSFEHASHMVSSVVKLLSNIVTSNESCDNDNSTNGESSSSTTMDTATSHTSAALMHHHEYTFGITSDPMTQFATVFSALIHDVDHTGVPNSRLCAESPQMAAVYKQKSVAEQNSLDLAWDMLQDDSFQELRSAIYTTPEEQQRFRQLVVNSVLATDMLDQELSAQRNERWQEAFSKIRVEAYSKKELLDRKATVVIEHLMQASDCAHTMQHWHVYRKWNERLFREQYQAYVQGRAGTNPADDWYEGEIQFFDSTILPLARKLQDCGVFGVSSDEYLQFAEKNRAEWEVRGKEVVATMLEEARDTLGSPKTAKAKGSTSFHQALRNAPW